MRYVQVSTALLIGLLVTAIPTPAFGRQPTPVGELGTPAPTECQVRPRSTVRLERLLGPAPADAQPVPELPNAVASVANLPTGETPDAETVAGITATAREVTACLNAGDYRRLLALSSDNDLRRRFGGQSEEDLAAFLASVAPPAVPRPEGEWIRLVAVRDAVVMGEDQVGAIVEVRDPTADVPDRPTFTIFVRDGDSWLIDGIIQIGTDDTTA